MASALGFALLSAGALHAQPAPFYDVTPSLASLRPAARQSLGSSGVGPLDSLPGYNLTLTVQPTARTFALHEELYFTNTERSPMREVVLRLYANAVRPPARRPGEPAWAPPVRFTRGACVATTCAVSAESPSVLVVRPGAPLAPGARLRVTLDLEATLPEIAAGRTGLMAQGMESLSALSAGESGGDYGLLALSLNLLAVGAFYVDFAVAWRRCDPAAR